MTNNNGYLTSFTEVDGSTSNEIQDLQLAGNILTITNNGGATSIDLSAYLDDTDTNTQLTETQVDDMTNNNGYLTSFTEVDGSTSNEIQDLQLVGNTLKITNNGGATSIDLSAYLDDTDTNTQLTETQVDDMANNNGYLTSFTEIDGSTTNEIQDLSSVLTESNDADSKQIKNLQDPTDAQDAATKAYLEEQMAIMYNQILNDLIDCEDYEGNSYNVVKIGDQIWMSENLNSKYYSDGTPIVFIDNPTGIQLDWEDKASYYYNFDPANGETYGIYYTWNAAVNYGEANSNPVGVQGVCPSGWHVPSLLEWSELRDYVGGNTVAGNMLKETGTTHWLETTTSVTDEFGFSVLGSGVIGSTENSVQLGETANFWASDELSGIGGSGWTFYDHSSYISNGNHVKYSSYTIRCVKD